MGRETDMTQLANEYYEEGAKAFEEHKLTDAILSMQSAKRLYNKVGNMERYVRTINWLGVIYAEMGINDMAMNFYIEGMEASIQHKIYHAMILFFNNIGSQYLDFHKYDKALIFFKYAEQELANISEEEDENVPIWYIVSYMNIIYAYNQMQEYDKSELYIQKAMPYMELEENKKYSFSFQMVQYDLLWRLGRTDEVVEKVEEIVEGICESSNSFNYIQDVQMACELLESMQAYRYWGKVLDSFEEYAKKCERIPVSMLLAEMRIEYYKQLNNREKYVEACIYYTEVSVRYRKLMENELANAIDIKLELREKENDRRKEQEKSHIDSLTVLGNRYKLEEDSKKFQKESIKKKRMMMVGILDVDCFKQYNDTYGHIRGDECLRAIANVLREALEGKGDAYRFGGDEFVVMGTGLSYLETLALAKEIQDAIADLHIPNINSNVYSEITISQGYCVFIPEKECVLKDIIHKADIALYQVKKEGRNGAIVLEG